MRIKVVNQKGFFREILEVNKINLIALSKKININYSTLKKYARGEYLIPEDVFVRLIGLSGKKEIWLSNSEKVEDNWGACKAGKISALKNDMNKRMVYARKFKKVRKLKIKINELFCELYGALMGDGCISRFKDSEGVERLVIYISGNKKLDSDYLLDFQKRIKNEFNISSYFYRYKSRNLCFLSIHNKSFASFLNQFGFPIGLKYGKLKIPERILQLSWDAKKMLIRGLFDTDGSICAKKREGYKYPQISISLKDGIVLKQLYKLLRERGYPCWISGDNLSIRGAGCTKKWMSDIGSSNKRNLFKYDYWLKNGVIPKNLGP
jgi:intein/homing endonuclease